MKTGLFCVLAIKSSAVKQDFFFFFFAYGNKPNNYFLLKGVLCIRCLHLFQSMFGRAELPQGSLNIGQQVWNQEFVLQGGLCPPWELGEGGRVVGFETNRNTAAVCL